MKSQKEMLQALLDGKVLVRDKATCYFDKHGVLIHEWDGIDTIQVMDAKSVPVIEYAEWEIKPEFININNINVPKPNYEALEDGTQYYIPDFHSSNVTNFEWRSDRADYYWLRLGFIHLTEEAAKIHLNALLTFTRK